MKQNSKHHGATRVARVNIRSPRVFRSVFTCAHAESLEIAKSLGGRISKVADTVSSSPCVSCGWEVRRAGEQETGSGRRPSAQIAPAEQLSSDPDPHPPQNQHRCRKESSFRPCFKIIAVYFSVHGTFQYFCPQIRSMWHRGDKKEGLGQHMPCESGPG